jgi:nucleoside-diphosphate-sugar epimerase
VDILNNDLLRSHYKNKQVLVTGGGGFIGKHLVTALLKLDSKISILQPIDPKIENINFINADITNKQEIKKIIKNIQPKIIFHLAGQIPQAKNVTSESLIKINFEGTVNLIEALSNTDYSSFINTCTGQVYGNHDKPYKENFSTNPASDYARSKLLATKYCQEISEKQNLPISTLRFYNIYGPYQAHNMFIPAFINACIKNQDFKMTKGEQKKDLIYVKDVISAFLIAAQNRNISSQVFNIASGISCSIKDIADKIVQLTETKMTPDTSLLYRDNEIWDYSFDISKARDILKWTPLFSIKQGLKQTIDEFKGKKND